MLRNKSNKIFSEINDFFTSSEKAIFRITELYKSLKLTKLSMGVSKQQQSSYYQGDILFALLLFPIFSIKNVRGYLSSSLFDYFTAHKDTFYRFKNNCNIQWRTVLHTINKRLFSKIDEKGTNGSDMPRCLIVDDTDFQKTGFRIEHISKIWSHVSQKSILGFKGLFLGYWDGKSFFGIDFSLHKEKGKNKKKPYGLNNKQHKSQYRKNRPLGTAGSSREAELDNNKVLNAITMVKRALKKKLKADYLLMDSWFVCDAIIKFLMGLPTKIHLVGMMKMAKAKYDFESKQYTAKEMADIMKRRKRVKWVKSLNLYCAEVLVEYKGVPVKLFFCKNSKRGKWHLLLTTNTLLTIEKTYEIYSIRWSIEVFFKESKQYFGLGKSQSRDFDAQVADISIAMAQYNIFSLAKRFCAYETIGELFSDSKGQLLDMTVAKRLWGFILELLELLSELFDSDVNDLIVRIMKSELKNNKIVKLMQHQMSEAA